MGIKIVDIDEAIGDNGLKVFAYGDAGAGKTVLCSTMNQSTIILSAEAGLLSLKKVLRQKPELKKLIKVINISCVQDLEDALELFTTSKNRLCNWICLDSISEIAEQILKAEKEANKDARQAYGNLTVRCLDILREFRDLPHYNVLMTGKMSRHEDDDGKSYFAPLFPGKGVGANIPYLFDEVFALRIIEEDDGEGGIRTRRILQTNLDLKYYAKDRSGELNDFEPANMAKIFKKIRGFEEQAISVSASEDRYWWHSEKDKYLLSEENDDVSHLEEDDRILEISKEQYESRSMKKIEVSSEVVEDNSEEEIISTKHQYWHHVSSDGVLETEIGTDISSLINDANVVEINKETFIKINSPEEIEKNEEEEDVVGEPSPIPANETKLQKARREMAEAAALAAKKK